MANFVCNDCIKEKYLSSYIYEHGEDGDCKYCKRDGKVLSVDDLTPIIIDGFKFLYTPHGDNSMTEYFEPDSFVNGAKNYKDAYDLLNQWVSTSSAIKCDIEKKIQCKQWFDKSGYDPSTSDKMGLSWLYFSTIVKDTSTDISTQPDDLLMKVLGCPQPKEILSKMLELFERFDLYTTLPIGTTIYRARAFEEKNIVYNPKELGSPPAGSQPNRFSEKGVSMFYGAENKKTCLAEAVGAKKVTAEWELAEEMKILDLTRHFEYSDFEYSYPEMPSIFDKVRRVDYHEYKYILDFASDLSRCIGMDTDKEIEYRPTQVVVEYLQANKPDVKGICVYSSKYYCMMQKACKNFTFFLDNNDCCEGKKIKLIPNSWDNHT